MTKKQKPLDDSIASEFVFGGGKPQTGAAPTPDVEAEELADIEVERGRGNLANSNGLVEKESPSIVPRETESNEKSTKESSQIEKLRLEAEEETKRFTVDLRESVHRKLSILATKTGRTKADIVRMLLDDALEDVDE